MKDNLRDVIEITDREADGTYRLMYTTKVGAERVNGFDAELVG